MRLTIRFLGLELLTFEASTDEAEVDAECDLSGGTTGSTPMGFTPSWGDARWEQSPEFE